jgi:hypothetical protein
MLRNMVSGFIRQACSKLEEVFSVTDISFKPLGSSDEKRCQPKVSRKKRCLSTSGDEEPSRTQINTMSSADLIDVLYSSQSSSCSKIYVEVRYRLLSSWNSSKLGQ